MYTNVHTFGLKGLRDIERTGVFFFFQWMHLFHIKFIFHSYSFLLIFHIKCTDSVFDFHNSWNKLRNYCHYEIFIVNLRFIILPETFVVKFELI